jgi:hypothetical protein
MNHIFYVETTLYSACNTIIQPEETLWGLNHIELAREFIKTEQGKHLKLGEIKRRFSKTVQDSYISFGCYNCDSIFGDWFVMDAQMEAIYGYRQVATIERELKLDEDIKLPIPPWCYPNDLAFCDMV